MQLSKDGWIDDVACKKSPHYNSRPNDSVKLLVVHGISLPRGEFGGEAVSQLFCGSLDCNSHSSFQSLKNLRVSAHFFIRRDGQLIQFVSCDKRAWHAGRSQWRGENDCNDFSIGVELEGADDIPYESKQYSALGELFAALEKHYPGMKITGHQHISPGRKTDPGEAFDWQKLFDLIGESHDGRADL